MTTAVHDPGNPDWARWQRPALLVGVGGLVLFGLLTLLSWGDLAPVLRSYLVAWTFWLGIALGCLVLVMLQYLTGGAWGLVLRRLLESASQTLFLLAVLFVPLALGVGSLYEWVHSDDPTLAQKQQWYLNVPGFLVRAGVYFTIWLLLTYFLSRWSRQQDERGAVREPRRFQLLSAPGLGLYGLTITFASIDWVMSLEPHWSSSIYGALFGTGQVLSGFAFAVAMLLLLADRPPLVEVLRPEHLRDLGSLLLAFVMLWAYMSFSQFLLIWAGNLPEEIPYYLKRLHGGWQVVGLALIVGHFALPFVLLLSTDLKRDRRTLAAVAGFVLVMRFVDLFWLIVPAADSPTDPAQLGLARHWLDLPLSVTALVGLGGIWVAVFLGQLRRRPLVPAAARALVEGTHHA